MVPPTMEITDMHSQDWDDLVFIPAHSAATMESKLRNMKGELNNYFGATHSLLDCLSKKILTVDFYRSNVSIITEK